MRAGRNEAKRDRVAGRQLNLAAREHPSGVAIHQQRQQYRGVIRRAAPTRVGFLQGTDIESILYLDNKLGEVVLREPFIDRGRRQVAGLAANRMKAARFSRRIQWAKTDYPIYAALVRQAASQHY